MVTLLLCDVRVWLQIVSWVVNVKRIGLRVAVFQNSVYYELMIVGVFIAILVYDVLSLTVAGSLNLHVSNSTQYVDLWSLGSRLRTETGTCCDVVACCVSD